MRTYHIHGKLTVTGFHLSASLSKLPPKNYYYITECQANTIYDALILTINNYELLPPSNFKLKIPDAAQASFIED